MKAKAQRNDPCPCGSGRKYKHCCEGKTPWYKQPLLAGILIILVLMGAAALAWSELNSDAQSQTDSQGRVWDEEHGHYH